MNTIDTSKYSRELRESCDATQIQLQRETQNIGVPVSEKKICMFERGNIQLSDPEMEALLEGLRAIVRRRAARLTGLLGSSAPMAAMGA